MRMVAVAAWFDPETPDAAARTLWETSRALRRGGHEVIVAAGGPADGEITRDRIIVRTVAREGGPGSLAGRRRWQGQLQQLAEGAAREADAQAVWLHRSLAVEAAASVAERLGIPLICSLYAPWEDERFALGGDLVPWRERSHRQAFEERACRSARAVLASSAPLLERLTATHPRLGESGHVAPAAVDPALFGARATRDSERAALQIPPDACQLVVVRHLTPGCGVDTLLDVLAPLAASLPTVHLAIGGHGAMAEELAGRVADHPMGDRLRWLGHLSDDTLARWLGVADAVVAPASRDDWTGLPILEALACGTPVIATPASDRAGRLDAVDPDLRLPDDSEAALSAALQRWAGDAERLTALRERSATAAGTGATWTHAAADFLRILEQA